MRHGISCEKMSVERPLERMIHPPGVVFALSDEALLSPVPGGIAPPYRSASRAHVRLSGPRAALGLPL